jgi:tRNA-dihydrouridine synthase 3
MAPMAQGGNLPYRRLCREFGAVNTCSEMVLADKLVKGGERPLIRHHETETDFGIQITGKRPEIMADAARIAVDNGARFVDLNFGCPIDLIVRRGSGAALLKRPNKLATIVAEVRAAVDVPLSVKLRLGFAKEKLNCVKLAQLIEEAGGDCVGLHGRTRSQRYRLSADWTLINETAETVNIPVLGNGDILTTWDLQRRLAETAVSGVIVARGALMKPWIFKELAEESVWNPTPAERWAIMRRYFDLAAEHFGDDEKGLGRIRRFFLWHLQFWCRWRPWTHEDYLSEQPSSLIQLREPTVTCDEESILLASTEESDHHIIWQRILDKDFPME